MWHSGPLPRANRALREWANLSLDIHLELQLDTSPGAGLRSRLEEALREAIRSGRLPRGARLPASRALARDLGISRGTVLDAYTQLAAEGWIAGVQGSGTVVTAEPSLIREASPAPESLTPRYDMRPVVPDPSSFPRTEWLRALRRALTTAPDELFSYTEPRGLAELRTELAGYLARARGLQLAPDNLVITTGFTQGLNLVVRAIDPGRVAMEEPSIPEHRAIVRSAGHQVTLLPVDDEGADVSGLARLGRGRLVVLTPNRQHPLGVTLSTPRRAELLDWARSTEGYVVENDYDGEFRYDIRPLTALQALEPARVIYAGTTSKSLAPGLRLGWLAVPDALVEQLNHLKLLLDNQNAILEQLAFAEFLRSGNYDRHIRKQRLRYRRRRDTLLAALPPGLRTSGAAAGLSVVVHLPDAVVEQALMAAAARRGIGVFGLTAGNYFESTPRAGFIVGYAATPERTFPKAVNLLVKSLNDAGLA